MIHLLFLVDFHLLAYYALLIHHVIITINIGEHESCGLGCKSENDGYKPKNLPYGKPLSNLPLRSALEKLF